MKITEFKVRELRVPLVHSYALSKAYGVQTATTNIIVEMHTDENIIGWGECDPWPAFTGDSAESVKATLKYSLFPVLLGKDPTNINAIHTLMDSVLRGNYMAKASIDIACYDVWGKKYGMPVHQLLGGKFRDNIRCFWAVGGGCPKDTANNVRDVKERGFYGCMIKIGTDPVKDAERTIAAREAVGIDFPLIVDANQGWDVETAIHYGNLVESANLLFFEQPVKFNDLDGLKRVRDNVSMPISADESIVTLEDAKRLIEKKAVDYFSIKVAKHGGIMPTKKICEYANNYGVKLFFNSMHEEGITQIASLHVASTTSNLLDNTGHSFFSTMRLDGDITDFYTWTKDGYTSIPSGPGLGNLINFENLDKYTVDEFSFL